MRRSVFAGALALLASSVVALPASGSVDARLQGTFTMQGRITLAKNIFNEHRGQAVTRTWTFIPFCANGVCRAVTLTRQRSGRLIPNRLVLKRHGPGFYVGRGIFWVPLSCGGSVRPHGGLAYEKISVRITRVQSVGGVTYATGLHASYVNPIRKNMTGCPGGIGHDAARYTGQLSSPLP
jgi:hypothetical protein